MSLIRSEVQKEEEKEKQEEEKEQKEKAGERRGGRGEKGCNVQTLPTVTSLTKPTDEGADGCKKNKKKKTTAKKKKATMKELIRFPTAPQQAPQHRVKQ